MVVGAVLVGLHIVLAGTNTASFLPGFLTDQGATAYTNFIVRPIGGLLGNNGTNSILSIGLWGLFGLIIYSLVEFAINTYQEWRADKQQVSIVNNQLATVEHPLERVLIIKILWRLLIGIALIVLTIGAAAVLNRLLAGSLQDKSVHTFLYKLGVSFAALVVMLHLYIVLLRLFMFRTRLFGEIIR